MTSLQFRVAPIPRTSAISPRDARESCLKLSPSSIRGSRECRTLGASAAACAMVVSTRVSHHGHAGNVRHSPHNGFNGFLRALLGDRAFLPPSPVKIAFHQLDASVGASGPHGFAVRKTALSSLAQLASIASRPTSVTIAKRPLWRNGMAKDMHLIWVRSEPEYFYNGGWTGKSLFSSWPGWRAHSP
jgi:hypothetical protein